MADNDGFGISGASFSLSGSGIVILFNNPAATGTYWAYNGANGTMRIAATLEAAIQNAGMTLTPTGYTAPAITDPALISPNYIGRLGNNAMVDAANTIAARYDLNVADIGIDLSGIQGRPQNIFTYANGNTFRPDLGAYTTQSQWSGATVHLDEVKAVQNLTGSARNLNQVQQYGRAITEINTESANMRLLGTAARNTGVALSVAGTGLDIWSNYRIADQYGWGNYQSNSSLIRSGISESGIWGTGIYGGYSAWSAAAAAGRTLAPFEVLGAGLRLSGEVAGPVMVGASLAQIGYGVYSDNWSYGPHAQHAVEDNAYELTSAGAGAGIGFVVAGPPGALVGLGIGYGVGSLAHITSNAYNDYASQFPDSGPEQWDGGMPGPTDSAPAGNSPGDGGINNGAAGNSPSDGMRLSTGLGVVGYYDPEKGAWVSLDAGPETGAPAESIPGVFQRYTPLDSLAPATSPEQVVPQGADTTSDPGAAGGSFGDTGGFGGDTGDTGGGDTGGGSSGGGSSGGSPVVLDLSGKGIKVTPLSSSNMFFDMANNGHEQRTAWAGAGNGVLVYDPSGGAVAQANQVNFTLWDPAAKTDMQALRDVFDSNHDGALNSSDTNWNDFRILVTNADGTQTLETLAQAGVTSINLNANSYKQGFTDGSSIDGETTFTRSDGTTGPAASVTLANDGGNYNVQQTVTHNSNGSTTVTNAVSSPDGALLRTISTTTSADGHSKIMVTTDGSGIVLATQTDNTAINSDGSTTETLADTDGAGIARDKTVTTTSADAKTFTINRDPNGAGYTAQLEADVTNTDGSTSVSVSNLTRNGTLINKTVSSVSADGLTHTAAEDINGDGVTDLTQTDATVINSDGSRTETITDRNSDGSVRDSAVTVTSANGLNRTTSIDSAGSGAFNLISSSTIVNNSDGSTKTTRTDSANNGSMLDQTVTTISAGGLTTTTQIDAGGDGTFDLTHVDQTVVDSSGNRTRTITEASAGGTVYAEQVTVHNADGKTGSISDYINSGSGLALTLTGTKTLNSAGALVDTVTTYAANGTKTGQTVTTTSANGLTETTQVDPTGAGTFEVTTTSTTVKNSDGSSTVTVAETAADGTLTGKIVKTTSANGLTVTSLTYHSASSADAVVTDDTLINHDGSTIENVITTSNNGTLLGKETVITSADRSAVTTTTFNGDYQTVQSDKKVTAPNGVTTDTVAHYNPDGTLANETVTTVSANGLSVTTQTDRTGNGTFDAATSDTVVLNADGSRTETVTTTNGTAARQVVTSTSANGLSKTTTVNLDGKVDYTVTDNTVFNTDGSSTETVTKKNEKGTAISSTSVTTSGNGLSVTTQVDQNGDGTIDLTRTDVTVLNADGSRTKTVTNGIKDYVRDQTVTTTNASGTGVEITRNTAGLDYINQTETVSTAADGSTADTISNYAPDGSFISRSVATTSANGLTKTAQVDSNGDGVFDATRTEAAVYNADGSTTVTRTQMKGTTVTGSAVITTAGNGLSSTASTFSSSGTLLDKKTDTKTIYTDGSTKETVNDYSNDGTLIDQIVTSVSSDCKTSTIEQTTAAHGADGKPLVYTELETITQRADGSISDRIGYGIETQTACLVAGEIVKTTSANGLSHTFTEDYDGDGVIDNSQTDAIVLNSDGSTTETYTDSNGVINHLFSDTTTATTVVTTTSANGLNKKVVTTGSLGSTLIDHTLSDNTVINADGSKTETKTVTVPGNQPNQFLSQQTISTSASGLLQDIRLSQTGGSGTWYEVKVGLTGHPSVTHNKFFNADLSLFEENTTSTDPDGESTSQGSIATTDATFVYEEAISTQPDGSLTATVWRGEHDIYQDVVTTHTSADGLVKTVEFTPLNEIEQTLSEVKTPNADGSNTVTQSTLNGNATLRSKTLQTTSADGLSITTTYDVDGDGTVDETTTDITLLNSDGSRKDTVTTTYADGVRKSQSVTVTSANGLNRDTTVTIDGYGTITDTVIAGPNGLKTEYLGYENTSGSVAGSHTIQTTPDGRLSGADSTTGTSHYFDEFTVIQAGNYGSYIWMGQGSDGDPLRSTHIIDANGAEDVKLQIGQKEFNAHLTVDQYAMESAMVDRLYSTLLNRAPAASESQTWLQYHTNSGLDLKSLAKSIISSGEFKQKFGALTNTGFVEQIYQNALGRNATMAELRSGLSGLSTDPSSWAHLAEVVSESAEHIAYGNVYQSTNNTYANCNSGTYSLDHPIDKAVVSAEVQNLYHTALGRAADSGGLSNYVSWFLSGSQTFVDIAASMIVSPEFNSKYGSLSDENFVSQIFANGLGRQPTADELAYWSGALGNGTISRADFVEAIAQSPDHLQKVNAVTYPIPFKTITVNSSGLMIATAADDVVVFGANLTDAVTGSGATLSVQTGDVITMGSGASAKITGSGATIVAGAGTTLTFAANATDTVSGSGMKLNLANGDDITASNAIVALVSGAAAAIRGDGNAIAAGANASVGVIGSSNTVTATGAGVILHLSGSGNTTSIGSGTVTLEAGSSATVNGTGNTITEVGKDAVVAASGGSDKLNVSGVGNTATISSSTVQVASGAGIVLTGSSNAITAGANASVSVIGSANTVTATGAGVVLDLSGTANTASIASGTVTLEAGSSATVNGNNDTLALKGGDTLVAPGTGLMLSIDGTANSATVSAAKVTLGNGAGATVTGGGNAITESSNASLVTIIGSGPADSLTVTGTGNQAAISGAAVQVQSGAGAVVTGANNTITAAANASVGIAGNNNRVTATGTGVTLDFAGTGDTATISSGTVTLENGAQVTTAGSSDAFTQKSGTTLTVTGSGNTVAVTGIGNTLSVSSAQITLENGASVTATGANDAILAKAGSTVAVTGSGMSLDAAGAGVTGTLTGGKVKIENGASATINGNSDAITETGGGSVTATGSGITVAISGTGNSATLTSGVVTLAANASATVNGNANTITENGGDSVIVASGKSDTLIVKGSGNTAALNLSSVQVASSAGVAITGSSNTVSVGANASVAVSGNTNTLTAQGNGVSFDLAGTGNTANISGGKVTLEDASSATVNGSSDAITLKSGDTLSVNGTCDPVTVLGTGNAIGLSFGTVTLQNGAGATVTGNGNTITETSNASVTAIFGSGAPDTLIVTGTGNQAAISGSAVQVSGSAGVAITGSNDVITAGAKASVGVAGNSNVLNATGNGGAFDLRGSSNTANLNSGSVTVETASSATVNGTGNAIVLKGSDTVAVNCAGNSADVAGTGNTLTLSAGQVTLESGAAVTLNGWFDALLLKGGDTVLVNGCTDTADISGTGNTLTLSYSILTVEAGAGLTLKGDASTITAAANASINVAGSSNVLTATGTGAVIDLNGSWNTANMSAGTLTLESGATATVNGSGDTITMKGKNTVAVNGRGGSAGVMGTGNTLNLSNGQAVLENGAALTLNGNNNALTLKGSDTVTVNGFGDSADVSGTGNTLTLYNGQATLESGAQVSLTGWTDVLNLKGGNTVAANGGGDTVDVHGTGNTITNINYSAVTLENGAAATLAGNGNTILVAGNNKVTVSGTGEAFVFQPAFGQDVINGFNSSDTLTLSSSDFASWSQLMDHTAQVGANTVITLDASDTITLMGVTKSSLNQGQIHLK